MDINSKKIDCSVVVSVFHEEECLIMFYESLSETLAALQISYEVVFVNDGSSDNSLQILKEIQLAGFKKTTIEYIAPERAAGKRKYSFLKLLRLSFAAISSFSKLPLQLGIFMGLFFSVFSIILIFFSFVMWITGNTFPGYTTLIIFMSAFAGIQLFITGLIGQYISYVFDEVKGRPMYIVDEIYRYEDNK